MSQIKAPLGAYGLYLLTWEHVFHNRGLFDLVKKGTMQPSSLRQEYPGLKRYNFHVRSA